MTRISTSRGLILFAIAVSLLILALVFKGTATNAANTASTEFIQFLQNDQIDKSKPVEMICEDGSPTGIFTLKLLREADQGQPAEPADPRHGVFRPG